MLVTVCVMPVGTKKEHYFPSVPDEIVATLQEDDLDRHIRILASDEFEGRGVGTPGEVKSVEYIAGELASYGFVGGAQAGRDGPESFLQHVPLQGVMTLPTSVATFTLGDGASVTTNHGGEVVLSTDLRIESRLGIEDEELVFGGYCINAPGEPHRWNDFERVSVRDKLVLCLVNQPVVDDSFGGHEAPLTYYGRWTYKFEEMRRMGAKGVLLLHTDESAGYGWGVIESWGATENVRLDPLPDDGTPLQVRGWISSNLVEKIVPGGVESLFLRAESKNFEPFELGVRVSMSMHMIRRFFSGANVVGVLPALEDDEPLTEEAVILTAHHDHFGIHPDENFGDGDRIYNGALDNASGVAKLLTIARVFGDLRRQGKGPKRRLIFITPTAEEAVLLGSSFYAKNPVAGHLKKVVAMINFDGMNIWGKTRDIVGIGSELSDIGNLLREAAQEEGMIVANDAEPRQGLFYRSDQLPFALAGVPAVKLCHGKDYHYQNETYFDRVVGLYNDERYHQVNDDYDYIQSHDDPYEGAMQEVRVSFRLLYGLANGAVRPEWSRELAFSRARQELNEREL
eukprot:CAMPEP_0198731326 /NCGR_PEP_ID=MMETSP1475-20131203/29230_1 /TAXON_ID= ORGANISM="Unidentified sp., Strain CCMP1999" /NCGR_SAMPLE_ID=MMETSP1475 /ASSEMBLY_ACC=CAM_ASM_001111 /LENGTH=568 /DNA_ID=CAMNT_0044494283 /DNA_START=291 /DNA_END=1997 /DNA_ORIENTATION=-